MSERLEHELHLLNGKNVSVVRPNHGTQSDHWSGVVNSVTENYPVRFHFVSNGQAIQFEVEDVVKIEPSNNQNGNPIIRLKGPQDYASRLHHV
jgi:hypothetical protein